MVSILYQYFDEAWMIEVENDFEIDKLLTVCSKIWEGELLIASVRVSASFEKCCGLFSIHKMQSGLQVLTQNRKTLSTYKKCCGMIIFGSLRQSCNTFTVHFRPYLNGAH